MGRAIALVTVPALPCLPLPSTSAPSERRCMCVHVSSAPAPAPATAPLPRSPTLYCALRHTPKWIPSPAPSARQTDPFHQPNPILFAPSHPTPTLPLLPPSCPPPHILPTGASLQSPLVYSECGMIGWHLVKGTEHTGDLCRGGNSHQSAPPPPCRSLCNVSNPSFHSIHTHALLSLSLPPLPSCCPAPAARPARTAEAKADPGRPQPSLYQLTLSA